MSSPPRRHPAPPTSDQPVDQQVDQPGHQQQLAPLVEIDTIEAAQRWVDSDRAPAAFQALDLSGVDGFDSGRFDDCLFLSCELTPAQAGYLTAVGATVIRDAELPFSAHRAQLYSVTEIFAGYGDDPVQPYQSTFDAIVYRHYVATGRQFPRSIAESLARRLHDHSITDALDEMLVGARPVAIMGGHAVERSEPTYATVARIARRLARDGYLMLSGGGPGAMEATHLGAWMAHFDDDQLEAALAVLAPRPAGAEPHREYLDPDWLARAFAVRERWPIDELRYPSIGIPTWMYGHEPPNAFASSIAKYFANDVREEGLLAIATYGVVFSPGSAGTVQELFQDTAQNHYGSYGPPSPMVLYGTEYWTATIPVVAVLEALNAGRDYARLLTVTDDESEVTAAITSYTRVVPGSATR